MGIFDFFKRKTDIEEYYEKREKEKRREKHRNFNNYTETPRKNTKLYERNETDKISLVYRNHQNVKMNSAIMHNMPKLNFASAKSLQWSFSLISGLIFLMIKSNK